MRNIIQILGVNFDNVTRIVATNKILGFLEGNEPRVVITANPEIVMIGEENNEFLELINESDLVVADGIGVILASRIQRTPLAERVAGYDLIQNVFEKIKDTDYSVYFLGAAPEVAFEAAERMKNIHKGLKIVGTQDGYFSKDEEVEIINEIQRLRPDMILVGLGAPKQEFWIKNHMNELDTKVFIGVGGSFDVMSGRINRAPKIFIKLGLEWFHRLLTQPSRYKRMIKLPVFLLKVMSRNKRKQ